MSLFSWQNWPILVICAGMLAAAVIDWWKFKVPNKLTFPLILSGWLLGLCNNFELVPGGGQGGIGAAVVGTLVGCALLIPVYAIGGMGAGDVKMTMGFGSWIGAFYGLPDAYAIIFWAFAVGTIAGGFIALGMIAVRGKYGQNIQHVKEILGDFAAAKSVGEVHDKANKRRPRWHRLPYGVPLCIGFIGYLLYLYSA
jgi:prepilin peptidase CpaA